MRRFNRHVSFSMKLRHPAVQHFSYSIEMSVPYVPARPQMLDDKRFAMLKAKVGLTKKTREIAFPWILCQ